MAKILVVHRKYEETPRRIEATRIEEDGGRFLVFNGDAKVADFDLSKVEEWSFEEE